MHYIKFKTINILKIAILIFLLQINPIYADNNFIFNKNIKIGSSNTDARELQKFLNGENYIVSLSGVGSSGNESAFFGIKTKKATILFQKNNNLTPDGIVGFLTREKINKKISLNINNTTKDYYVGGSISGFVGSIKLENNEAESILINSSISNKFTFPTKLANGLNYNIKVIPIYLAQKCFIYNGSGIINKSNINNINIFCSPIVLSGITIRDTEHTINIKNILGINIPIVGAVPTENITDTSQYTATIEWEGHPTVFTGNTSYKAIIKIIPKSRYTLKGIEDNYFNVNGAITTNDIDSGIVSAIFPATNAVQLTISNPTITTTKIYDENTSVIVSSGLLNGIIGNDIVSVSSVANYDNSNVGTNKIITVSYTLNGSNAVNYIKPVDYSITTGEITAIKVSTPSFSPIAGNIPLTVKLVGDTSTAGTQIGITTPTAGTNMYYTLDGTDPTVSSTPYTTPIILNEDKNIKVIAVKDQYINSDIVSSEYKINQSSTGIFSNPHGTVQIGNKFYVTSRTSPATITVFNNPNNLTDFQTVNLTGHSNADYLIYDPINDKLYASCYDNDKKLTIVSINPDDISSWSLVYKDLYFYNDWSAPIVTDGIYVYGAVYNQNPSSVFKIRISDWSRYASLNLNDNLGSAPWSNVYYPHSAFLVNYADRKEMYITTVWDTPARFIKVNLNGVMSYTSISLNDNYSLTDDIACQYIDETGSYCYAGTDTGYTGYSTEKTGFKIDTRNMTFTKFSIGGDSSYGLFIKDNNLYNLGISGKIVRYKNLDVSLPEIFDAPGLIPNEFFSSSTGKIYVTDWKDLNQSKIIEVKFNQ